MTEEKESESKQHKFLCVELRVAVLLPQDKHCKNRQFFMDPKTYNFFFYVIYCSFSPLF